MKWHALRERLRGTSRRDALEVDMDEELAFHIEMATRRNIADGMNPREARRRALVTFGATESFKEEAREARRARILENVTGDVSFAIASMRRAPTFAIAALLTMTIAIAVNTAMFSVVNGALLRPLPFPGADKVRYFSWDWGDNEPAIPALTAYQYEYVRDNARTFSDIASYTTAQWDVSKDVRVDPAKGLLATPGIFGVIGMRPAIGRPFDARDASSSVVILSDGFWRRRFGADHNVLGRSIELDGVERNIIGVMPPGFRFPSDPEYGDFIAPFDYTVRRADEGHNSSVIARIRDDVSDTQLNQELARLSTAFHNANPDLAKANEGFGVMSHSDVYAGTIKTTVLVLFGAVICVLLIGCANTANLLLVRAAGRQQEMAVRASLGAGRRRILQQLLIEGLVLAVIAGVAGVALGNWALHAMLSMIPPSPALANVVLDRRVAVFACVITLVTGLVFGLAAAVPAMRSSLNDVLRGSGRGTTTSARAREALVLVETALAAVLLASAGLLLASFDKLQSVDPGFDAQHVLAIRYDRLSPRFSSDDAAARLQADVLARVRRVRGVQHAAIAPSFPMERGLNLPVDPVDNEATGLGSVEVRFVSPEYLRTLGTKIELGRDMNASDETGSRVAVINQKLAARFWPNQNPIGRTLHIGHFKGKWMTPAFQGDIRVIGVSHDVQDRQLDKPARLMVYVPSAQWPGAVSIPKIVVQATDVRALIPDIEAALADVAPDMKPPVIEPLETIISRSVSAPRFRALLLSIFAASALLLAVIGIYGVIASLVQQKTREIGVRMALGASSIGIAASFMRRCMVLVIVGIAFGLMGALATTRFLEAMLFEITPTDPRVFIAVFAVLAASGLAAGFIPAHKAAQVDPGVTLRSE
jgi:predicted permease